MSQARAISRPRVRRRRPPSSRLIYQLLFLLMVIVSTVRVTVATAAGQWWQAFLIPVWVGLYIVSVKLYRMAQRNEEADRPVPVRPIEWVSLATLSFINVMLWVTL